MKKKKTKRYYFTKVHEDAIVQYCISIDKKERSELYGEYIGPAFNELVDKIVFTYKFSSLPNIDVLRDECKIWLTTILDKFDYYLPYPAGLNQNFYLPEKIKFYRLFEIITNKYNLKQVLLEPDYIIMRKNNYWIYDEKYINDYQKINNKNQNKLNTEYYIKEKFKEILIYAKK